MEATIKSNIRLRVFVNRMVFKVGNILMTLKRKNYKNLKPLNYMEMEYCLMAIVCVSVT